MIKIFQLLRLTAEIYGCFTVVSPIQTLRFAFVGKILFGANSCERQSTVRRVKEIWKKAGFQYYQKKRLVLLERDSRWSFSSEKMLSKQDS